MTLINRINSEVNSLTSWSEYRDLMADVLTTAGFPVSAKRSIKSGFSSDVFNSPRSMVDLIVTALNTSDATLLDYLYSNADSIGAGDPTFYRKILTRLDEIRPTWVPSGASWYTEFSPNDRSFIDMATYASLAALTASSDGSFARASVGTYEKSDNTVLNFASGNPRYDSNKGLLIEQESTNQVPHSADGGNWEKGTNITVATGISAPDGSTDATRYTFDVTGSQQYISVELLSALSNNTTYTVSFWAKTSDTIALGSTGYYNSGTVVISAYNPVTISSDGEWHKYSFQITTDTTTVANPELRIKGWSSADAGDVIEIWGLQIEEGSSATTTIPTSGSTVTREADDFKIFPEPDDYDITFTVDDDSTQTVSGATVTASGYQVPTNLNRSYIKTISAEAA